MLKTVMFIGAGPYQLPGIVKAKEMGLRVVATDYDSAAPGLKVADVPIVLDVKDAVNSIKAAKENDIDGVLSIAADVTLPTVAAIAEELSLPGISQEVVKIATDKGLMKNKFVEHGIPTSDFRVVVDLEDAAKAVSELHLPLVVKPVDNAGSRGVIRLDRSDDIATAFYYAKDSSKSGRIIIEEFVKGVECSIDAMTFENDTQVLAISEKKKDDTYLTATDITYPPRMTTEMLEYIDAMTKRVVAAIGLDTGASHTELIIRHSLIHPINDIIYISVLETAARGGGFGTVSDIIPMVSGVDALAASIQMCLGEVPDIVPKYKKGAVLRFLTPPTGSVLRIKGLEEAKKVKNAKLGLFISPGEVIPPLKTDGDRVGYIIAGGETRDDAIATADLVESKLGFGENV